MPELKLLFLQMAAILTAARMMAVAFRFIGQPAVIGEIAAGILLGPSLLGRISPAIMNGLFPAGGLGSLYALSQLGLVLFIFLVGLEVRRGSLRGSAKSIVIASQASIVAPFLLGGILAPDSRMSDRRHPCFNTRDGRASQSSQTAVPGNEHRLPALSRAADSRHCDGQDCPKPPYLPEVWQGVRHRERCPEEARRRTQEAECISQTCSRCEAHQVPLG